jgi:hypothetical protein
VHLEDDRWLKAQVDHKAADLNLQSAGPSSSKEVKITKDTIISNLGLNFVNRVLNDER